MRHVRDKLLADALQPPQLGDVVKYQHGAAER